MKHVASLRYDVIFKKAFSVPSIFSAFVSDVLGMPIRVERVETEKRFPHAVSPIEPRFDLYAEDSTQRIIVDIQHQRYADHYDRFLYYHCVALLEQGQHSKNYRPPFRVITIVILTSGDRHQTDMATIDFDPKDRHGRGLQEIPHQVIYLCPKYVNEETPPLLRQWMEAIEDTLDETVEEGRYSATIQEVFALIEQDRMTPQERAGMKEEYGQQELLEATAREAVHARQWAEEERTAREAAQKQADAAQEEIARLRARLQALDNAE